MMRHSLVLKYTHLHVYISVNKSRRSLPWYDESQCFGEVVVVPVAIWRIVWRRYTAGHVDKLASYRYHIWILFHGVSHPDEVLGVKFVEYPTKTRNTRKAIQVLAQMEASVTSFFLTKEGNKCDLFQSYTAILCLLFKYRHWGGIPGKALNMKHMAQEGGSWDNERRL